jgi:hypothetical protein
MGRLFKLTDDRHDLALSANLAHCTIGMTNRGERFRAERMSCIFRVPRRFDAMNSPRRFAKLYIARGAAIPNASPLVTIGAHRGPA